MDELDQHLQMILIDHDLNLQVRRAERTELVWPDESDIFIQTRAELHAAFAGTYEPGEHWVGRPAAEDARE